MGRAVEGKTRTLTGKAWPCKIQSRLAWGRLGDAGGGKTVAKMVE